VIISDKIEWNQICPYELKDKAHLHNSLISHFLLQEKDEQVDYHHEKAKEA